MYSRRQFGNQILGGAGLLLGAGQGSAQVDRPPDVVKHLEIYRQPGMFAGWPANHGAWQWAGELLVGFEVGHFKQTDQGHAIDYSKPARHVLARSLDGGDTWTLEEPASLQPPAGAAVAGVPTAAGGKQATDCPGGIDFTQPGFALTARMLDIHTGPSRFYYSYDKGKNWEGPFKLPDNRYGGMAARTDYLVLGKHDLLLFVTVPKTDGKEGMPVVLRTKDGGKSWAVHGTIGTEPPVGEYAIMPSTVRTYGTRLLSVVRHRVGLELFESQDLGMNWESLGLVSKMIGGNPGCLNRLADGRVVLTYGCRVKPFGIRARISETMGKTWGPELRLRTDGNGWDLGYVRSFIRPDGNLQAVYYYNDSKSPERYIGSTVWFPGDLNFSLLDRHYEEMSRPQQRDPKRAF
jgi:hypothetical protein